MSNSPKQNNKIAASIGALIISTMLMLRSSMEEDMVLHMLLQFPLIVLSGWLMAYILSDAIRDRLCRWNHAGITGLLMASLILMFWMIPRALDLVLVNNMLEFTKFLSLLMAGAALHLSWSQSGMIVRGFFLGNVLPMMMVVGWLYVEAPVRICNAYLTNDQLRTGNGLMTLAIFGSLIWLLAFFMHSDQGYIEPSQS